MIDTGILLVKDSSHKFIASNKTFSVYAGKKIEMLIGLNDFDMPWHDNSEIYISHEKEILKGSQYSVIEPLNGTKSINLITKKEIIYNSNGKPAGTIANAIEITTQIDFFNLAGKSKHLKICGYGQKFGLTKTESKIMFFLLKGYKRSYISEKAGVSLKSFDWHVGNIKNKFQVGSTTELLTLAYALNLQDVLPFSTKF